MKTDISIIVPIYNTGKYLPRCIESILNQSLADIELILVNDGSTDESGEICDQYARKDRRIRVFHQDNLGKTAARRKGLMASKSRYVAFVDSDDFVAGTSYELARESMEKDIDLIMFGTIKYYDEDNRSLEINDFQEKIYGRKEIEEEICPRMIWDKRKNFFGIDPSLCNKIIRWELAVLSYESIGDREFDLGEDVALTYPMIKNAETVEIRHQAYYYYRLRKREEVPPYVADSRFFDKLYLLFQYLSGQFSDNAVLLEQVEYYYMYFILWRKHLYGDYQKGTDFLFPFDKVERGANIVLYGAGVVGHSYMEQLGKLEYCRVVLWVDKDSKEFGSKKISAIDEIKSVAFDKVVIAIESREICGKVQDTLLHMGIKPEQIIF